MPPLTIQSLSIAVLSLSLAGERLVAAERAIPAGPRTGERIGKAFRKLDRDGDGRLSFTEWHRGLRGAEARPSTAKSLFRTSDLNRNLRLSLYEFGRTQGFRLNLSVSTLGTAAGKHTSSGLVTGSTVTFGRGTTFATTNAAGSTGVTKTSSGSVSISSAGSYSLDTIRSVNGSESLVAYTGSLALSGSGTHRWTTITPTHLTHYLGLSIESAQQLAEVEGRTSRVVNIDGVNQAVTLDWSVTRVNFAVVDGIVVTAFGG